MCRPKCWTNEQQQLRRKTMHEIIQLCTHKITRWWLNLLNIWYILNAGPTRTWFFFWKGTYEHEARILKRRKETHTKSLHTSLDILDELTIHTQIKQIVWKGIKSIRICEKKKKPISRRRAGRKDNNNNNKIIWIK